MGLPTGLGAQWCFKDEATYGVAPSLSGSVFYAVDNDTMELKKGTKQGTGIFQGSLAPRASRRVVETYAAQGAVVMDCPERQLNPWLYRMMGSYGQSNAALTQDAGTGAYKAIHALGDLTGHTFCWQKGAPTADNATVVPLTYTGCKVQGWDLSCAMSDILKLNLTIEGRNELAGSWKDPLNASVPTLQAYSAPVAGTVFRWVGASVYYGGTASTTSGVTTLASPTLAGYVKGPLSIKCTRPMDTSRHAPDVAPFRNEPLQNAVTQIAGSMTVEWLSSETYLAAYQADTATAIEYQFTGEAIGTGSDVATLSILAPNVRLDGESVKVPGPQVLTQTVPWVVLDDGVNNILQATYWTLDST